jgi:hypothetical protein
MATISVVKLKIRRGTESQRKEVVFDNGELGYVLDPNSRRLFVGDGVTFGGISVGAKWYAGSITETNAPSFQYAQIGDIITNTDDTKLYVLSGSDADGFAGYKDPINYQYIGPTVDNATIGFNTGGNLQVITNGISAQHINSSAFDINNGFTRTGTGGAFKINYDNTTIRINGSKQFYVYIDGSTIKYAAGGIYVDPSAINLNTFNFSTLPTTRPTAGSKLLWIDTLSDNTIKIAL